MREYHYVLTVQWTNPTGGISTVSNSGVYTPSVGITTREDVLAVLLTRIRAMHRAAEGYEIPEFSIVCWVLEPNELERPIGRQM